MKIRAKLLHMAESEIKAMIAPYNFDDIKRRDAKPLFKAFVVGQEGQAEASWVGVGKVVKTWFKDAIGKLSRKIWPGLKLFHNHADTNDPDESRIEIGEVAGSRTKMIDGKFSAVVAAYIYPEYKTMPLDIASIEADVRVDPVNSNDDVRAVDVEDVTGIALGSSKVDSPGFPGATLLGELQAFVGQSQHNKGGKNMDMTISEIKDFIKTEEIKPSDLFGLDVLTEDPIMKGVINSERKEASVGEYANRKRTDEENKKAREQWGKEKEEKNEKIKKLEIKAAKRDAVDLFATKIKERKLDGKIGKFIESKQDDFLPEDLESVGKEVDKFMDDRVEEFNKTAKIFGVKTEGTKEEEKPGSPPGKEVEQEENSLIPD